MKNKFRVWDKEKNAYCIGSDIATTANGDVLVYTKKSKLDWCWLQAMFAKKYTVQRCSGMKDKNGREIYEGDLVKGFGRIFIVKFGPARRRMLMGDEVDIYGFYFYHASTNQKLFPITDTDTGKHDLETLEVIGSINE